MTDLAIIGAGAAGLTAALYARRAGLSVLLLEAKAKGGEMAETLEINNYPGLEHISGQELTEKIYHQVNNYGVKIEYAEVLNIEQRTNIFVIHTDEGDYEAKSVILAVGSRPRRLQLEREKDLTGHGVSYCATCDGSLYQGQPVAVVGGGNSALYEALYLANLCSYVYIVHRRSEFRGDTVLVEKLKAHKNVEFIYDSTPTALVGDQKVEGLTVHLADGSSRTLDVAAVFVAIGRSPATSEYSDLIDLDERGYIIAKEDCQTSHPGVFVAGDCRVKPLRQIVTAAADGAVAAHAAAEYLKGLGKDT